MGSTARMRPASMVPSDGCCVDAASPVLSRQALISLMSSPSGRLWLLAGATPFV